MDLFKRSKEPPHIITQSYVHISQKDNIFNVWKHGYDIQKFITQSFPQSIIWYTIVNKYSYIYSYIFQWRRKQFERGGC